MTDNYRQLQARYQSKKLNIPVGHISIYSFRKRGINTRDKDMTA